MPPEKRDDLEARLDAMSPERWRQINDLLDEVLELPPERRAGDLERRTRGDPELRRDVEALLESHDEADAFLEEPAGSVLPEVEPAPLEGRRIGAYRVIRLVGQGGMGTVYLAEREDVGKRVAVKLLHDGPAAPELLQRFLLERRVLARLEHPYIARLLDAGVTESGAPYFAMEYVEGRPIDAFCDGHRLTVDRRLELFRSVCDAVQYAHQMLVVHRDLKPSNILVTENGDPRLLDFGIAKLLEEDPAAGALRTRAGALPMTPAYAAPEQIRGEPVTTAADVYGLGVVLYELLTGRRPHQDTAASELERAFSDLEPGRPSTAVTGAADATSKAEATARARSTTVGQLSRRLSGDLDAICLKALRVDPTRRYRTAEQLLEDLRRQREGLPVSARLDTVGYRLGKFVRRHRLGVTAMAAIFLALLGGFLATTWQARIARAERDRAQQIAAILPELFWNLEPGELRNTAVTPEEMLDQGLDQIEVRLADEPAIRAQILTMATDLYMRLGAFQKAEAAAREALAIHRDLYGPEQEDVAASMGMLAQSLDKQGRYDEAEPLHREALAMRRRLLGNEHLDVATGLHNYAMLLQECARYEEAVQLAREALAIRSARAADPRDIAYTQTNLGVTLFYQGAYAEAERHVRGALELRRQHLGNDHPDVANSLHNLAAILGATGELVEVESLFREALVILRKAYGDGHPFVGYTLNSLARAVMDRGAYDEAETLLEQALTIVRRAHGEEHEWVASVLSLRARAQAGQGHYGTAEALHRQAVAMYRRFVGEVHPETARSLHALGSTLMERKAFTAAEPILREALEIRLSALPEGHRDLALTKSLLGACLGALGRSGEAEPLLQDGLDDLREKLGPEHPQSRAAQRRLSEFLESPAEPAPPAGP